MYSIIVSAIAVFFLLNIVFIIAQVKHNNSIVDIAWGPGFLVISLASIISQDVIQVSQIMMLVMIAVWSVRLSSHIFLRSRGRGEDARYAAFREGWGNRQALNAYFKVFMLQGVLMLIIAVPIFKMNAASSTVQLPAAFAGGILFLCGLIFESIADYQLVRFKMNPVSKGKLMTTGLWKFTRHPNYFGEIVLWWGLGIYAAAYTDIISLLGPAVLNLLIVKVSGIPLLEQKYSNHPDWEKYKSTTPALIPFIPVKRVTS